MTSTAQAAPPTVGVSLQVSWFLPTREILTSRIIIHRSLPAKTHATATQGNSPIPLTVSNNYNSTTNIKFPMKKSSFIILIPLLMLSSCATVMNRKTQRIDIITNKHAYVKINDQELANIKNRTKFIAVRDIRPINLVVFNDSISKELLLDSRSSFLYWFNIYANAGLGMLIDKDSPKRYVYPKRVYVDMANNINTFTTYNPVVRKGSLQLHYSLPWINNFIFNPSFENSTKINTGFMGVMIGLDYYHKMNQFLNLSACGVMDFFIPFPGAVDFSGEVDMMESLYLSISNNYRVKRISVGYGFSYSKNIWDHRYYERFDPPPPTRDPVTRIDYSFGFIFPFYVQVGEYFDIGLLYRPSVLTIKPTTKFKYSHLLSIDFAWKIPIVK